MKPKVMDFDLVVAEHRPRLVRYAEMLLDDWGLAEDVAQESLLAVYENRHAFTGGSSGLGVWLTDIAWQKALDIYRHEHTLEVVRLESLRGDERIVRMPEPCHQMLKAEAMRALEEEVLPSQAKVVRMCYFEELSPESIAQLLGLSRSTVVSRLHRGITSLRFYLEEARRAAYAKVAGLDARLGQICCGARVAPKLRKAER